MATNYLSISNGHVDSLIDYVLDVKPYHTKLSEVVEEFIFQDSVNVSLTEQHKVLSVLGSDILGKSANSSLQVWENLSNIRPIEWRSAERTVVSDGTRVAFPVPTSTVPKLLSDFGQETFVVGIDDSSQIPGLTTGVYSHRRFDGPGIPLVMNNGMAALEGFDYHISYGAFSFNTLGNSTWKEASVDSLSQFGSNPGNLLFDNVYEQWGSIINITSNTYEEFTLTWNDGGWLDVVGSVSGNLGTAQFGVEFTSAQLTFTFAESFGDPAGTMPSITSGNSFLLSPHGKIVVAPDAPQETWTLIKTNPQALVDKPTFTRISGSPATDPILRIFQQSLEWTPQGTWTITFTSPTAYSITAPETYPTGPRTGDFSNGHTYKDKFIHFTITPPQDGFQVGDSFTFNVKNKKENFLVYGSASGWQAPATIGEWYWNGKIGFKIPPLKYVAIQYSSSISTSIDGFNWESAVVGPQELTNISYVNDSFIASGGQNLVAQSLDGVNWTDTLTNFATFGDKLLIVGEDGLIAETQDGKTWYQVFTPTHRRLNGLDVAPTSSALEAATTNMVTVVGDGGIILTSLNGFGWTLRESGTSYNLLSVAHNDNWLVAVGDGGVILRSQDRITWTTCSSPTLETINKVKFLNGAFWAVGTSGVVIKSVDAINWVRVSLSTSAELNDIAYGLGTFVAVGHGGVTCRSIDGGVTWSSKPTNPINAIEFGTADGLFVAVEYKTSQVANFTPLRHVHPILSPSIYSIVFRAPVDGGDVSSGTVQHSYMGYRPGFKVDSPWFDDLVSFNIGPAPEPYHAGERIDIFLVPTKTYITRGDYDERPFDTTPYDSEVSKLSYPLDLLQEYFPLTFCQNCVIFPGVTAADNGKQIVINKVASDYIDFRIGRGDAVEPVALPDELGAVDGWIPIEFRYGNSTNTGSVYFPDRPDYINAYLASDPDTRIFSVAQTSNLSQALLTFDQSFFNKYLPASRYFSLRFNQTDLYGQIINVKVSENLKIATRIGLILYDGPGVDSYVYDPNNNSAFPYVVATDPPVDATATAVIDNLEIIVRHTDATVILASVSYDVNYDTAAGGVYVTIASDEYVVTHNYPSETPTVTIIPDSGSSFTVVPSAVYAAEAGSLKTFSFTVGAIGAFKILLS